MRAKLKITAIDTLLVDGGWRNWVFLRIATDGGIDGWGEATLEAREYAVAGCVRDMTRRLIGGDPAELRGHVYRLARDGYWGSGPVVSSALGGIEIALWDIQGKRLELPVYQMLGGRCRDEIKVYSNAWYFGAHTPSEFAERAVRVSGMGFRALKFDPFGFAEFSITPEELSQSLDRIAAVRAAVGPGVELLIEGHGRFSVHSAIRIGLALERFSVAFFEEPVRPGNPRALAQVAAAIRVPVAAGERTYDLRQCVELLSEGRVSILQPDVIHVGGIGRLLEAAAVADTFHVAVAPHNASGPIGTAATLHAVTAIPNLFLQEMFEPDDAPWKVKVATPAPRIVDGRIDIPGRPGLGLEVDVEELARHPLVERDLNFYDDRSILEHGVSDESGSPSRAT